MELRQAAAALVGLEKPKDALPVTTMRCPNCGTLEFSTAPA
jgi:hypothetical protein